MTTHSIIKVYFFIGQIVKLSCKNKSLEIAVYEWISLIPFNPSFFLNLNFFRLVAWLSHIFWFTRANWVLVQF